MKVIGLEDEDKKQKYIKRNFMIGVAIFIALIVIILIIVYASNREFRDFMDEYVLMKNVMEDSVTSISLEETNSNKIYAYDKYIAILSDNKLIGYNSAGNKEYELTVEITNPIIDTNNRFLIIAEKEKQKVYLISGSSIVWEKELEGDISKVSVNKNGYTSIVLTGTTYKSIIQTFDSNGNQMFKTYLSNDTIDSDISNDNRYLSFAEVSTNGTMVQTMIKTISIQKAKDSPSEAKITTVASKNDSCILNIKYQDGNKLVCMYDNLIDILQNENSEELFNLKPDGQKVTFADIELGNYAYRISEKSSLLNTQSTVEIASISNKNINTYLTDSVIKEVYAFDDKVALNLGSEVHFIGSNGWLIKKYISSQEIRKIVIASNFAGIVYRDKIELVQF